MTKKIALGALVLLLVGGLAAGIYFVRTTPHLIPMSLTDLQTSKKALSARDFNTAIVLSKDSLQKAQTPDEKANAHLVLAESLWGRNQSGDREQAIADYKAIVNATDTPAVWKALTLNDIAVIVNNNNAAFYARYFADEPYADLMPSKGTDAQRVKEAYLKLLELSDATYPNSFAEYAIAGNYYAPRIAGGVDSASDQAVMAQKIIQYVTSGDAQHDEHLYSNLPLIRGSLYRAIALSTAGRISGKPALSVREEAYTDLFNAASQRGINSMNDPNYGAVLTGRFFYAKLLLEAAPDRQNDIVQMLQPFASVAPNSPAASGFIDLKGAPGIVKSAAKKLASISSDFNAYLQSAGVSF